MGEAKLCATSMDTGVESTVTSDRRDEQYREAVGALAYLMIGTPPDIACSVVIFCKYVQSPGMIHWNAVKRLLRYVVQTKNLGLCHGGIHSSLIPIVYVGADWAGYQKTRQSMGSYIVIMGGAAISCFSRQKEVVALLSTESEYISLCAGVKE